jgi:hypothetical protein
MTSVRIIRPVPLRRALAAVACMLVYACSSDSASAPQNDDAARAANVFTQMSDSIVRSGGDTSIAGAYASLGDAIRRGFRVSPVTIEIDGVPTQFMATAQQTVLSPLCLACISPVSTLTLRSFIAWQASDPRRVVQVGSEVDADSIRAYVNPTFAAFPGRSASLIYFDGKGGTWFGTSGTQHVSVSTSDAPCSSSPIIQIFPPPPTCTLADFTVDFSAKAEPSTFLVAKNPAAGTHTFAMTPQSVAGVRLMMSASLPPGPPITIPPRAPLSSTLGVKVDSLATITLSITNAGSSAEAVLFSSGQHSDFSVYDGATGERVWNSSMGMLFTQVVSTDTLAAGAKRVFTAYWTPAKKGAYIATGSLVSRSHVAEAKVPFNVP